MTAYIIAAAAGMALLIGSELFIRWCKRTGHENWIPPEDIDE